MVKIFRNIIVNFVLFFVIVVLLYNANLVFTWKPATSLKIWKLGKVIMISSYLIEV